MREQLYHSKELFFVFRMFLKVATFRSGFSTSQLTYYMSYHHAFDLCRVLICEFPEVVCMGGGGSGPCHQTENLGSSSRFRNHSNSHI